MSDIAKPSAVSIDEIHDHLSRLDFDKTALVVEALAADWLQARVPSEGVLLRPGGFLPGPTMMSAVDLAGWLLVFTRNGITPMAMTWDLSINFLRPAHGGDLMLEGRQTKFGKLCHATYDLWIDGDPGRLVAHATTTYALPTE